MYKKLDKNTSGLIDMASFGQFMKQLGAPDGIFGDRALSNLQISLLNYSLVFSMKTVYIRISVSLIVILGDGMVDFKELVTTMSIGLRGTPQEKMERMLSCKP